MLCFVTLEMIPSSTLEAMLLTLVLGYTGPIMKNAARWTAIIALFTIPFLPLYVAGELFFPFITGKNFAFRILIEIAVASYAVLAILDRKYRPRFSWMLVLFTTFVAWMAIANLLGVHPHKAFWSNFERMDGWIMLIHVYGLFIVATSVLTVEKLWRRWWLFFLSVAAFVCLYGLIQATGGAEIHQGSTRITASFGNAIYMAVYVMFSILIAGWLAVTSKGWVRYALGASALLSLALLLLTASRGPLIGLVAGVGAASVLWLGLSLRSEETRNSVGLKWAVGGLLGLLILIGGFYLVRDSAFVQETPALDRLSSVFTLSEELEVRSTIWGIALKGVQEDPMTGWGQEGFNQIFNKYYEPSLYAQEAWFDRAHNMYIDWLVAGGVPALLLFVSLLALAFFALLRAPEYTRAECVLLVGALVAYAVQALVVFDNLFSYVPLAILLAMAHASSSRAIPYLEVLPEVRSKNNQRIVGVVAVLAAGTIVWMVNVPSINAAGHLVYAVSPSQSGIGTNLELFEMALNDGSFGTQEIREQLVMFTSRVAGEASIPADLRSSFVTLALEEMGKEIEVSPNDARLRSQYAQAFESAGMSEESIAQLAKAVELSPKKQALHISYAFSLYRNGQMEEAREAFRRAYELDPSFDDVAMTAAAGYILTGSVAEGKALLMESVGTTTPSHEILFFAYYQAKQWNELIGVAQARVATENGSPTSRFRLAQAYAAANRIAEARSEIEATVLANPDSRAEGEALLASILQAR